MRVLCVTNDCVPYSKDGWQHVKCALDLKLSSHSYLPFIVRF